MIECVVRLNGLESQKIERRRRAVFLEREKIIPVIDDVRICSAATQSGNARIIHVRVAVVLIVFVSLIMGANLKMGND